MDTKWISQELHGKWIFKQQLKSEYQMMISQTDQNMVTLQNHNQFPISLDWM